MKDDKIYNSWAQLTVAQFEELCRIQEEHPKDSAKYIIEYLYDVPNADDLPMVAYSRYIAGLQQFIGEPVLKAKLTPSCVYTLNGRVYRVDITPSDFTVAQYIDLTNYLQRGNASLVDLLSVVVIPDGCVYNDGYDMAKARTDIESLPLTAGFAVVGFFARWSKGYTEIFLRSLTRRIMKGKTGKIAPETEERLKKEVEVFLGAMASSLSFTPTAVSASRR